MKRTRKLTEQGAVEAVCFDFDGTLARFEGDFDGLLEGLRMELGLVSCDFGSFKERVILALRQSGPLTLRAALARVLAELEVEPAGLLDDVAAEAVREYAAQMTPIPESKELLRDLRAAGIPLALASNGPEDMQRAALESVEMLGYFSAVLISGDRDVAVRKPHPRIFGLACTALESLPERVLMVGNDPDADIAGALEYGMQAVLVELHAKTGRRPEGALSVTELGELRGLLRVAIRPGLPWSAAWLR